MRQEWSPEELLASWTLVDGDWKLVANKSGPTRLGFCLMLKFFEIEARFPEFIEEFPQPAVEYVAGLVKVPAAELAKYDLAGAKRHRKQNTPRPPLSCACCAVWVGSSTRAVLTRVFSLTGVAPGRRRRAPADRLWPAGGKLWCLMSGCGTVPARAAASGPVGEAGVVWSG